MNDLKDTNSPTSSPLQEQMIMDKEQILKGTLDNYSDSFERFFKKDVLVAMQEYAELYHQQESEGLREEWIDPKERLPEKDCNVLALCENQPYVLWFCNGKFYMDFHLRKYFEDWTEQVSVWSPLPSPPHLKKAND